MAQQAAEVAEARAEAAGSALWPRLYVRFGYNYERPNQRYFPVQDRFDGSWDLSLILSWTAWDWGVTYYGAKAARAEASAAARNIDQVQDAVRLDVERRRREYLSHRERASALRQSVGTAERALERAKILFAEGRITSLDLLDAETELARARSELVQALANARTTWARVERAVGRDRL